MNVQEVDNHPTKHGTTAFNDSFMFLTLYTQEQEGQRSNTGTAEGDDKDAESAVLRHRMRYTGFGSHGNDPLHSIERYTHTMSSGIPAGPGKMDVSITHSRNQSEHATNLLTQHSLSGNVGSGPTWSGDATLPYKESDFHKDKDNILKPFLNQKVNSRVMFSAETNHQEERQGSPPPLLPSPNRSRSHTPTSSLSRHKTSLSLRLPPPGHVGPSIAPASLRALATHKLRPITCNTMVRGRAMVV